MPSGGYEGQRRDDREGRPQRGSEEEATAGRPARHWDRSPLAGGTVEDERGGAVVGGRVPPVPAAADGFPSGDRGTGWEAGGCRPLPTATSEATRGGALRPTGDPSTAPPTSLGRRTVMHNEC